jgi:hypothetical protein
LLQEALVAPSLEEDTPLQLNIVKLSKAAIENLNGNISHSHCNFIEAKQIEFWPIPPNQ